MILIVGALLGFLSVALGAYAEHGLREVVTDEHFRSLMTALRYHQIHAVMICSIGLVLLNGGKLASNTLLRWSGITFITGTVLFSFSIYASILANSPALMRIAPMGGMMIMIAWVLVIGAAVSAMNKER